MNLDRDHDPDRLVGAWLDEGPRTFSPGLLDRTLAEIHATRQQRHRPVPWSPPRMNLRFFTGLAGAAVLAVLFAATAFLPWLPSTFFGPAGSPTPSPVPTLAPRPSADATSQPQASPAAPTFLAGDVPFEGTTWQLVGRIDGTRVEGDPVYISPVGDEPATIRFDPGRFSGFTGCHSIGGTWEATPRKGRTFPADLAVDAGMRTDGCAGDDLAAQDVNVIEDLDGAGAIQVTAAGYEVLASDLADADLDPALLDHYRAFPDLTRLIVRDQSGEGTLIYGPIASPNGEATGPVLLTSPQPFLETDWRIEAVTDGAGGLAAVPLESEAAIRFKRVGDADRFDAYNGCESVQGDFALDPRTGQDGAQTLQLVPSGPEVGACSQITLEQARAILSSLADVGSVQAVDRTPDAGALGLTRGQLDARLQRELSANPDASRQLLRDRSGTPILLLVAAGSADPPIQTSPAPGSEPEFLTGQVPFEGTDWLLVGHGRGTAGTEGPALVSPAVQAWLRFEGEAFSGSSGCFGISGPVQERPDGDAVTPMDLLPIPLNDYGCRSGAAVDEDALIIGLLEQVETVQLTRGGPEMLGSGLVEADLDPTLAAHLREHPDVPRLVFGDEDGPIVLVYAPVAPGYVIEPPPGRGADVGLVGPRWGLAGWWTGTEVGFADSTRNQSLRFAPDGTFAGSTGCGTVSGRWGTVVGDTVQAGPWVVDQERLAGTCDAGQPAEVLALLRSVDPSTITVTQDLAAELPERWQGDSASHLLRGATYLLLRDDSGEPVLAYWVLAEDDPAASAAPSPSASPTSPPTFVAGDVTLQDTTWQLVGRSDAMWGARTRGPAFIAQPLPAWMRIVDGVASSWTPCSRNSASWDVAPDGDRTTAISLRWAYGPYTQCGGDLEMEDTKLTTVMRQVGGFQVTRGGYDLLASGLSDDDLEPALLAHYQADPDLVRLILRDRSGEGLLIYAPIAPDVSELLGRTWGIAGYRTDDGLVGTGDPDAVTVRFDDDGTFTAADGCGTLGGVWGLPVVADGPPVAGETDVDVSREWCLDDRSQEVLRALQDLELGNGVVPAAEPPVGDDAWPDDLARSVVDRGGGLLLRDPEGLTALVLVPSERLPSPSPQATAAPSTDLAFLTGDAPVSDTTWVLIGHQARTSGSAPSVPYKATLPSTTPWIRMGPDAVVGDTGCDRFVAERPDVGAGEGGLFRIVEVSGDGDCTDAQVRQSLRFQQLLEQATVIETDANPGGWGALGFGLGRDRSYTVAEAIIEHYEANPDVQHLKLDTDAGTALLVFAPVDGGIPGTTGTDPRIDPAPGGADAVGVRIERGREGQQGSWALAGWRDAAGRLRAVDPDRAPQVVIDGLDRTDGDTGCQALTGQLVIGGEPDDRGVQPATWTRTGADTWDPTCDERSVQQEAALLGAPIAGIRIGPETLQLVRSSDDVTAMDPWLWAWLANEDALSVMTLVDDTGRPQLIFAPIDG